MKNENEPKKLLAPIVRGACFGFVYVRKSHRCVACLSSTVAKLGKDSVTYITICMIFLIAGYTLTHLLHLVTYIELILCRGVWFVNGSCTCSHREDLERSIRAKSRCLLLRSARIIALSCVSLSKWMSAASPNKWCEVDTPPTPMFTFLLS